MRVLTTITTAATLVAVTGIPAQAAGKPGGWEPTSTPPFVLAAGQICAFEVKGDIVADREWMRTVATFPDGSPRVQDFTGVLVIRYTNTANHRSVVRDATGAIRLTTFVDGTRKQELYGDNALPVKASNTGFPGGDYITRGYFVVVDHPGGVREIPVRNGTMENLCRTLA